MLHYKQKMGPKPIVQTAMGGTPIFKKKSDFSKISPDMKVVMKNETRLCAVPGAHKSKSPGLVRARGLPE